MTIEFTVDHDHTYAGEEGIEQLIGWITFSVGTSPGDFRVRDLGAGMARTINLPPRRGWLAADGHLYKDQTLAAPCRLVANDPAFNLRHLTYRADFALTTLSGDPIAVPHTFFSAPSTDTTLPLTKVMADPYQPVMEIRPKVYAEDILDAGDFGQGVVFTGTAEDFWDLAGSVPSTNLPSYVDDVIEFANVAAFPATGESGKIYVDLSTGDGYRWTGSTYLRISDRVTASGITDSGTTGRDVVRSESRQTGRNALGAKDAGDVFNWHASNTRKLQRSLAKAVSGQGTSDHLIIGDSTTSCYIGAGFVAADYLRMWPEVFRRTADARGIPLGGTGWIPAGQVAGYAHDPRYTHTGTWAWDAGYLYNSAAGETLTFTADRPGTAIGVAYYSSGSAFTVSVDGGTPVSVSPPGGNPATMPVYTVTGLSDICHTVTIATTGVTSFMAMSCYRTTGLRIHNMAQIGAMAQRWAIADTAYGSNGYGRGWVTNRLPITPDVIHLALGVNDLDGDRTAAQVVADLTTIRNVWASADVILHGQMAPSPTAAVASPPSNTEWSDYIGLLRDLAVEWDCPLVDMHQRSGGSYAAALANGLMGDTIHPNRIAQADWGLLVANHVIGVI